MARSRRHHPALIALLMMLASLPAAASGQSAQLGRIAFTNSGAAAAQDAFLAGVLLMHNFEYEDAATSFREAQRLDPDFALAYWGEALSYNHAVWMEQDRDAAQAALARLAPSAEARAAKARTERERAWLHAVETLYGNTSTSEGKSKNERDDLYRDEMRRLFEASPEDDEAASFYALSILGTAHEGRDFATYMRAAAVVEPVFDRNPDHPGAAHYLIHSYDDPIHAPLGLPMARAYSRIAPAAGHAQHMTSHIFVAMGMWDDVVSANVQARDVQNGRQARLQRPPIVCGHYTWWLEYGYLQQGRLSDARSVLDACFERVKDSPSPTEVRHFSLMRARLVLDAEQWDAADAYTLPGHLQPDWEYRFTDAMAALKRGRRGEAEAVLAAMAEHMTSAGSEGPSAEGVLAALLGGAIQAAAGDGPRGAATAERGAVAEQEMPYEFGPPAIIKPGWELVGELLLDAGNSADAAQAFRSQLDRTPGRTLSLLGLARSAAASGDRATAEEAYAALSGIWAHADPAWSGLAEVRSGGSAQGARR